VNGFRVEPGSNGVLITPSPVVLPSRTETNAADPAVIGGVALLLGAIGLLASWVPTRRALRVHPMEALRYE